MISFMGIAFDVVAEDTTSVTLRQIGGDEPDVTIMRDSARYRAMFAKPKFTFADLVSDAEQELKEIDNLCKNNLTNH